MFSSFTKLLPNNVSISTPDFLKPLTGNSITSTAGTNANSNTSSQQPGKTVATSPDNGKDKNRAVDHQESQTSTTAENESANGAKEKKKRKDAPATETFIIVRPPPSMSNHPLNLQVQLVASQGITARKQRSASTSTTASNRNGTTDIRHSNESRETLNDEYTGGASLQRTTSLRSNRSDTESTYSASSTLSTFNSGGSSSGRRMIPLYNLHAHNVMTNVITDAGTDAKIAKFFKRGLEIMGLAMLEPVEVYGKYGWNDEGDSLHPNGPFGSQIFRTTSNLVSRNITPNIPPPQHAELPTVIEVPSSPTTPKPTEKDTPKKLFGNLFKKKKDPPAPLSLAPNTAGSSDNISTPMSSKRKSTTPSVVVSSPSAQQTSLGLGTPATASMTIPGGNEVVLQSQILGLQAVLQSPVLPPKGRPSTYVWVVKKWIKGSNEGLFEQLGGQIGGAMNALVPNVGNMISNTTGGGSGFTTVSNGGSGFAHPVHSGPINGVVGGVEVEVRFEWRRGSRKGERRRKMATGSTIGGGSTVNGDHERRHSTQLEPPASSSNRYSANLEPDPTPTAANKRLSFQGFGKKSPPVPTLGERDVNGSTEHLKYSRAPSPNPPASVTTTATDEHGKRIDDGEESESDPEDSERPWNCYLHIRALPPAGVNGSKTTSRSQSRDELSVHSSEHEHHSDKEKEKILDIKLRAACLAPAPHHPKVIAQIKAPYPLPDVLFDSRPGGNGATLRDRIDNHESTPNVNEKDGVEKGMLLLTAEEIKDVVSCTGLWLVVREGYGGLARKRKGDGWRLRG